MKEKTKLITIDYDEYLGLTAMHTNFEREVLFRLRKELYNVCQIISNDEVQHYVRQIINKIENDITYLEKEGE